MDLQNAEGWKKEYFEHDVADQIALATFKEFGRICSEEMDKGEIIDYQVELRTGGSNNVR